MKKGLYKFAEFTVNTFEYTLSRDEEPIPLPLKVAETLCLLVENHGKLLSKDFLMNELWKDSFVEERNLTQNVFLLRKVLNQDKNGRLFIETVPKRGYKFVGKVTEIHKDEFLTKENVLKNSKAKTLIETNKPSTPKVDKVVIPPPKQEVSPQESRISSNYRILKFVGIIVLIVLSIGAFTFLRNFSESDNLSRVGSTSATLALRRLTDSGKAWHTAISPDAQQIAYIYHHEGKDRIRLKHIASNSITDIVSPSDAEFGQPVFSPEGNYIFYPARDGGKEGTVYKTALYGGSKQVIVKDVQSGIDLSPDGKWLTFIRHDNSTNQQLLIIAKSDGTEEKIIVSKTGKDKFYVWGISPAWSSDGKKIVVATYSRFDSKNNPSKSFFVEINVETGKETLIKTKDFHRVAQPRWMPDGKSLIVLAQDNPSSTFQVWQILYPSGKATRITQDLLNYKQVVVSPDGSFLLTNERIDNFNLFLVNAKTGLKEKQISKSTSLMNGFYGLDWTPDDSKIVYSRSEGIIEGNIWLYDLKSDEHKQLTFETGKKNIFPIVAPDGKAILFSSNRDGTQKIWRMNIDGGDLKPLTQGPSDIEPQISADEKWLIYADSQSLWKQALSGGEKIKLLDVARRAHISPNSKQIVLEYLDKKEKEKQPWKNGIISINGKETLKSLEFFSNRIVRWNKNGSGIYYLKTPKNEHNVWLYSIADKTSHQITNFKEMKIVNLALSKSGKQLVVSRGFHKSEIIQIRIP